VNKILLRTSRGEDVGDFLSALFSKITPHTSDIHIHTQDHGVDVGVREYGELRHVCTIPRPMYEEVKRRLKIYCRIRIDIEEKGQDGSFSIFVSTQSGGGDVEGGDVESGGMSQETRQIFIRTSFLPTVYGQTIVMRLSGHRRSAHKLEDIISEQAQLELIRKGINEKRGLIVVTGPTGSGKTETLYVLMREMLLMGRSVVSIEDPVESYVKGIKQVRVSEDHGFTFKLALKSVLRQDPDVIVVGETRDHETAELVDLASHTGHLVITTLHVGSITEIPERLFQLGITRESLSSSAVLFIGQRLIKERVGSTDSFVRRAILEIGYFDKNLSLGLLQSRNSYEFLEICRRENILLLKDRPDISSSK
jgi:type IV pilus assembly protein PilB